LCILPLSTKTTGQICFAVNDCAPSYACLGDAGVFRCARLCAVTDGAGCALDEACEALGLTLHPDVGACL
jgi:hypothetical protein